MNDDPDIQIGPFSLRVLNRQFPDSDDYWDGNWLDVRADVNAHNARVRADGPIIQRPEIGRFLTELEQLQRELRGKAQLKCIEPNLDISLLSESLGHLKVTVSITPEHLSQEHRFLFELDQTYLPPLISSCRRLLSNYPIKGSGA